MAARDDTWIGAGVPNGHGSGEQLPGIVEQLTAGWRCRSNRETRSRPNDPPQDYRRMPPRRRATVPPTAAAKISPRRITPPSSLVVLAMISTSHEQDARRHGRRTRTLRQPRYDDSLHPNRSRTNSNHTLLSNRSDQVRQESYCRPAVDLAMDLLSGSARQ